LEATLAEPDATVTSGPPDARSRVSTVRYALVGATYVLLYAAAVWALATHPSGRLLVGAIALIVPATALGLVVLRRRREWFGCQRLFWDAIAIGAVLWIIGYLGRLADALLLSGVLWPGWHTVFTLSGSVAPVIALMARPHRGVRAASTGSVALVLASYGLLAGFIYAYFVLIPTLLPGSTGRSEALVALGQGTRVLLIAGATASAWAGSRTPWRRTYLALAAGGVAGLLLRAATSGVSNSVDAAGTAAGVAWLVPFLMYLWAAIDAPPSPGEREVVESPGCPAHICVVPAFLIPLIGYTVPLVHSLGATGDSMRALLTGLMTVCGLGLLTLRLSAQGGELARADGRARLLAAAIEETGDAIVITRADGSIEHANDAFLRAVGYTQRDLASLTSADVAGLGFEAAGGGILQDVKERGIWRGTLVRRRSDGSAFHAASTVVAVRDSAGRIVNLVGVERDITDDMNRRDQLVHTERLSAMGALVAGVAHEINNPLQTILGSAEVLLEDQTLPSGRRELELVRLEARRAAQIVRSLLSFVRRTAPDRAVVDLNEIVAATVELRHYHLERSNIVLDVALHPAALPIFVNREEIQQIVLNLVLNAEHALERAQGGRISIRTLAVGQHRVLEVADDGPGISKEVRGRIFEPFFTTKEVGEGTGLGLSISHGIAYAHGGSLELCAADSGGACFRLLLPAHERATAAPEETAAFDELPNDCRSALVVDDEIPIRRLLRRLLERRGFDVVEAESGEAAMTLARERPFRIVLCDVRMPVMSGVDFYTQLCALKPSVRSRFVFMSGDAAQARVDGLADNVPILKKPFTSPDLDAVLEKTQI
jgi:PAS domain S-box-containing protein